MKLSAPPPPPPPSPELPSDGTPGANDPVAPEGVAPASETPEPPPVLAPKALLWPAWYGAVDAVLAGLVLVFAFVAASFVARNSDLWLHLAAGKRLFAGQYTPGSDPFSYTAADRAWVNHSWLTDAAAYLLYGGEGKVLVVAKALVVALTFGLLIAIRRPKFALWPWAVVACVAVLAAAPQFTLRPQIVSMLFLALTLFLLFRMPQKPNSWQFPAAIGVTFWLWANCDPWFFVGPLALALLVAGDLIETKLLKAPDEPASSSDDEPLGRLPDTLTLAKALGVGVLACMLNPHHVRVWELPFELTGATGVETDPRLRSLFYTPIDSDYMSKPSLGENANGLAYAVLFVAGAAALGFGYGRLRVAHVALWIGFAGLSLLSVYTIPFFALVAVPLVAAQLNAFSLRTELKSWGDPKSRLLLLGSTVGRVACVLGVLALCVCAYPGWLQPEQLNPAYARRVAWGVEPDPALKNGAEQFKRWRDAGRLPADARGVIASADLANYVAWFAPQEKVFFNARYNHHRRELPDYLALRKGMGLIEVKDYRPNPKDVAEVLTRAGAEYVAVHAGPADGPALRARAADTTGGLFRQWGEWSAWYLDGRTTVFGWTPPGAPAKPTFAGLRVDPLVLAFGPDVKRVPEPELKQPLAALGWEEPFVRAARPGPVGAVEALAWLRYKEAMIVRQRLRGGLLRYAFFSPAPSPADALPRLANVYLDATGVLQFSPRHPDAESDTAAIRVAPLLALRAARRAIAEDPDHPDPYYALAQALRDRDLPMSESERTVGMVTAYRQCLDRLPPPDKHRKGQFGAVPTEVALSLAELYLGRPVGARVLVTKRNGKAVAIRAWNESGAPPPRGDDRYEVQEAGTRYAGLPIDLAGLREPLGFMAAIAADKSGRAATERVPFAVAGQIDPNDPTLVLLAGPNLLPLDVARELIKKALQYAPVDLGSEAPAEETKKQVQRIEGYLKELEGEVVRADDRYAALTRGGQALPGKVQAALYVGLPGKALELLSDKDADLGKEYKDRAPDAALLRVALELAVGRVENASEFLADLGTPENAAMIERARLAPQAQHLRYQKALFAGEYKVAGDLWEAIEGTGIGALDKIGPPGPTLDKSVFLPTLAQGYQTAEPEKVLAGLLRPPLLVPGDPLMKAVLLHTELTTRTPAAVSAPRYSPVVLDVWVGDWVALSDALQRRISSQMQYEVTFFYRRGVLALMEGDVATAKQRFQQATRTPPKGWRLPEFAQAEARLFLRQIEAAERRAAAP